MSEMTASPAHATYEDGLTTRDFTRLRELIYAETGICLGPEKKTMVEVRLKRRLRALNMATYSRYCEFIFARRGAEEELISLINVITTNKTDFFREPAHFNFLVQKVLPESELSGRPFVVWSAGCSSGEEPYTMAMVLSEYAGAHPGFCYRILATDISTSVLEKAQLGIYSSACVEPVPIAMKHKYLMRSRASDRVRVVPELRRLIEFRRLNFKEADYAIGEPLDAIFCRNVLIYFDRATQENILRKLIRNLAPSGYLFVGHSETLHDMDLPLEAVASALYRKADDGRL